jgi:lipoate-protein ligase A
MEALRLLPFSIADGPHHMAADEVILETALAGVASLRFYGWSTATVSLGYFQPEGIRLTDPRLAALPYVRRPSGGAALVHDREVTYALGLPAGAPWQSGISWLGRMHQIIGEALLDLDVEVRAWAKPNRGRVQGLLCYRHLTPGDLLIGPAKVVGSAQRRHRGALMQHGSILLAASAHAPTLPGIAELAGKTLSTEETVQAVKRRFVHTTTWPGEADDWTARERARIEDLATGKYGDAKWNAKR